MIDGDIEDEGGVGGNAAVAGGAVAEGGGNNECASFSDFRALKSLFPPIDEGLIYAGVAGFVIDEERKSAGIVEAECKWGSAFDGG